jgi:hypothetical protein
METILQTIMEALKVPALIINQWTFIPEFIRDALIQSISFIPILYFLYLLIEYLERFFLTHIGIFIKLVRKLGALFGVVIANVPECGYPIIASIMYSRKMMTRGTLLAFLIVTSDDAIPLLFMDLSKASVIIPIIIIKIIVGLIVAYLVDFIGAFSKNRLENVNAINTDIYEPGCCYHRISSIDTPPYWWMHPLTHTFNMFMFTFICLAFINCVLLGFTSNEHLAQFIMIDSPYQVIFGAVFGLIPNCVASIFIAMAYIKGIISFPTLLAALITTSGLSLFVLLKHNRKTFDNTLTIIILLLSGIIAGLVAFYNIPILSEIQNLIRG